MKNMQLDLFGVPSHAGALHSGTEFAPEALRHAGVRQRLMDRGFVVLDHGDLIHSVDLPRHNNGAVRNWPAPRVVWDETRRRALELFHPDRFSLLLGGDCSMVVGTFAGFREIYGECAHLIVLDGQVDNVSPRSDCCIGAAAMGLWFLTRDQGTWWTGKSVKSSAITVVGPRELPSDLGEMAVFQAEHLERDEELLGLSQHLLSLPTDARIFVHVDVDVLHESVMSAAYSPNASGLSLDLVRNMLRIVLSDPRVKGMEVTEFCPAKDPEGQAAGVILGLLDFIPSFSPAGKG